MIICAHTEQFSVKNFSIYPNEIPLLQFLKRTSKKKMIDI